MKAVLQRVLEANVHVNQEAVAQMGPGLLVYLGVEQGDGNDDLIWMVEKVATLRIFPDQNERMNFPITEVAGDILLVSQFTLCADLSQGKRPSFTPAAPPQEAEALYLECARLLSQRNIPVQTGVFAAHMQVSSVNDGPATFLLDSRAKVR